MVVVRDLLAASLSMAVRCHCDAAVFGPAWLLLYAVCVSHIFLVGGGLSLIYNGQALFCANFALGEDSSVARR